MLHTADPNTLLAEADQILVALAATEAYMKTLAKKKDEIFAELDVLTAPVVSSPSMERIFVRRGYSFLGEDYRCPTYLSIYLRVLAHLWSAFPEMRDAIAKAVSRTAYNRRYISQDRMKLFKGMSEEWTTKHSTLLNDGWYVDTNVNKKQIGTILSRAVAVAGLKWGEDVRITWDTRVVRVGAN